MGPVNIGMKAKKEINGKQKGPHIVASSHMMRLIFFIILATEVPLIMLQVGFSSLAKSRGNLKVE